MKKEVWYNTKHWGGLIQISNKERVRSFKTGKERILSINISDKGYKRVTIREAKTQKVLTPLIHRLLAEAVIPNPHNLPEVNHKDGNKLNNSISNLEWCDKLHNMRHAFKTGLMKQCIGENKPQSKLNEKAVVDIFNSKESCRKLAKKYGVCYSLISGVRRGSVWNHVTKMPKKYKSKIQ